MFDVITFGSAVRDVYLKSKNFKVEKNKNSKTDKAIWLPLGSKLSVEEIIFETGGGATNAATTFARQRLKTACISKVGKDPGAKAIVDFLEKEGVDTKFLVQDSADYTGYAILLVTASGERTALVYRGASSHFDESLIPPFSVETKWVFITSLGGNVDLLKELILWAEKAGAKIAFIPGKAELEKGAKILSPIFAKTDVVIMNREEAADLTGIDFDKKEKIVHKMCLLTKNIGVITDGPYGSTACDGEFLYHIGTHGNRALDRTGAGDAFASGFVAGLLKYENIEAALELAADNASSVVNYFGAKKGILRAGEKPFNNYLKVSKTKIKGGVS